MRLYDPNEEDTPPLDGALTYLVLLLGNLTLVLWQLSQ